MGNLTRCHIDHADLNFGLYFLVGELQADYSLSDPTISI